MAITNVLLWFTIWTPYACVTALPALGYQATLTPLVSQIPSFAGKHYQHLHAVDTAVDTKYIF